MPGYLPTAAASLVLAGALAAPAALAADADDRLAMLDDFCIRCHNDIDYRGNHSFESLDPHALGENARVWEAIARKVRAGMMPPQEAKQPDPDRAETFLASVEGALDAAARANPAPPANVLHRLNRTEYANAIRDVLGLEIDSSALLPADDSAGGFDNMAQGLTLSPVLLEAYLSASAKVAALAVGDPGMRPVQTTYRTAPDQSQDVPADGAPLGTVGGLVFEHYFPLDGEYEFEPKLYRGILAMVKGLEFPHTLEVAIDGERVHLASFGGHEDNLASRENAYATADAIDARLAFRRAVTAGPHRISVTFLRKPYAQAGEVWQQFQRTVIDSNEDKGVPHLDKVDIVGPFAVTGPGDTPSRRRIFTCRPEAGVAEKACATEIVSTLARRAWRRPVERGEVAELLSFYEMGRQGATFDKGIETAIRRVISGPEFVFRAEVDPPRLRPGTRYRVSDLELASRLSFFLWSSVPDDELLDLAARNRLGRPEVLDAQVRRMLADPKARTLVTNFAAQWLTLRNLKGTVPDPALFPDFDNNLREGFIRETELLVESVVREDRNVVDLLNADYTFVNERLARHYGIPGVYGPRFRRVPVVQEARRGLLGHGSILTLTSVSTRTSAVTRGKWVLANLLANEPPPPPPDVPALEASAGAVPTTLREQLAAHREDPTCAACHQVMDPIGFALENFDAVGRWRERDGGLPIDASDMMFDGTMISGSTGLREFLVDNQPLFVRALTEKLMSYGLGRAVDYYDMPAVRQIIKQAEARDNRFSSIVLGIVNSDPFLMRTKAADEPGARTAAASGRTLPLATPSTNP